jgi:hypothetical protein
VASAAKTDPEWIFRTEVLCQWSDGSLEGPFPPGTWEAGIDGPDERTGHPGSQIVGNVKACVDVSADRSHAHIAFAGLRSDGLPHVEIVASRAGTDWVTGWLAERTDIIDAVTGQGRGAPVSSLLPDIEAAGLTVTPWQGSDLANGTGSFYDLVRLGVADKDGQPAGLRHLPQPLLDVAAATAVVKMTEGGAFLWDRRRSPTDIAPLVAATGAVWLLTYREAAPVVSAYETGRLEVL